ncbi:MAG: hypothetical protein HY925_03825 [Elusimicrobia bacterium]|nr:hypothetical protein [Elusimicrobiota bacterium]
MRASRGVILVHVMILVTLLAWVASMFLSAVLSRQIVAKQTMKSSELREAMSAASARITSCLAGNPTGSPSVPSFPVTNACTGTATMPAALSTFMQGCLGGTSPTTFTVGDAPNVRPVSFVVCSSPASPPCRFRINVCEPGDTCAAPSATCP